MVADDGPFAWKAVFCPKFQCPLQQRDALVQQDGRLLKAARLEGPLIIEPPRFDADIRVFRIDMPFIVRSNL